MTNFPDGDQINPLSAFSVEVQADMRRAELELPTEKYIQLVNDLNYIPVEKLNTYIEKFVVLQEGLIPITILCDGSIKNIYR